MREQGFTLIELLTVMVIIGILSSIAIPQFKEYRARGYDTAAQLDLRNLALAEEAYYLDHDNYLSCANAQCANLPGISHLTPGVTAAIQGGETDFTGNAQHSKGSGKVFRWDSSSGGFMEP